MIKSFRGLLADGGQDRIRLQTTKGKVGYRIVKFAIFPNTPGTADVESTFQIFNQEQSSVSTTTATVDFSSPDLLGVAYMADRGAAGPNSPLYVIFDNEVFNQDIYITHTNTTSAGAINYYFELERIELNDMAAEYTTIKDIRSNS